jgi:large subunit ribosomal protein L21
MPEARKRKGFAVYAIVRCGGRQEKVTVEDVLAVDKVAGEVGSTVTLPAVLVVDDGKVVSDPKELARYEVTAEILGESKGPKLSIMHYKNKTGYKRRLGHRQTYTEVKITDIAGGGKSAAKQAASKATAKPKTQKPRAKKAADDKAEES